MTKVIASFPLVVLLAVGVPGSAGAQSPDLNGLAALQKENVALRARIRRLEAQQENAALRTRVRQLETEGQRSAGRSVPANATPGALARVVGPILPSSPGMAADYPTGMPVKAWPSEPPAKGQFDFFVEGGGFQTGGEPALTFFRTASTTQAVQGSFDLKPRIGWDAAAGFDYQFAGSSWHVSAQARLGEAKRSDSASSSAGPTLLATIFGLGFVTISEPTAATNREAHWLADFAVGHDLHIGADAMQVKLGVRAAELTSKIGQVTNAAITFTPLSFGPPEPSVFVFGNTTIEQDTSFRGAGPRIGVDGTIPLGSGWEFDYLAGGALLFGTRRFDMTRMETSATGGVVLCVGGCATHNHIGATVPNVDVQAGFAYWITPNFRLTASYRLDAYFGALAALDVQGNQTIADRYFHGPRIAGTVRF